MSDLDNPWLAWAQSQDVASASGGSGHLNTSREYRNIWVFAETAGGFVAPEVKQALGKARELGDWLGARIQAIALGPDAEKHAQDLIAYGADTVIHANHPALADGSPEAVAKAVQQLAERYKPEVFLFGGTRLAEDLAPRVAAAAQSGFLADAIDLELDDAERLLRVTRATFGGKIQTVAVIPERKPQVATVRAGAFREADFDRSRRGEVIAVDLELADAQVPKIVETLAPEGPNLETARVIVVGGKGVGDKANWALVEQLAEALGAQVGATKGAVAAGWADPSQQIGLAGKKVKPELYVAVGVSGSLDHQGGMAQARTIVAFNTDKEAPIMALADLGIVGDLKETVPAWTRSLMERSGKRPVAAAT